jgi:3-hydroxybutyryl-CoA dehydratase
MALKFEDLEVGQAAQRTCIIDGGMVEAFADLTGDHAPVHLDAGHARALGFAGCIAHGLLVAAHYSTLLGQDLPGPDTVILKFAVDMVKPVDIGDTLYYKVTVTRTAESMRAVTLDLSATNSRGETVSRGSAVCVFRR